jgi:hypothetical protein
MREVKDVVGGVTHKNGVGDGRNRNIRQLVQHLVGQSEQQFTPQDHDVLRFWTVLAPTLLWHAIEFTMEGWNPHDATEHGCAASNSIIYSFFFDEWSQITSSNQKVGRGRRNRQSNHDDVRNPNSNNKRQ